MGLLGLFAFVEIETIVTAGFNTTSGSVNDYSSLEPGEERVRMILRQRVSELGLEEVSARAIELMTLAQRTSGFVELLVELMSEEFGLERLHVVDFTEVRKERLRTLLGIE